jgi:hypothetical protein
MAARTAVRIDDLRRAAAYASPNPDGFLEKLVAKLSATLRDWSAPRCDIDARPGALATAF